MNKPIKITYIIDTLDSTRGGTENQLVKLINGLDKSKFQIQLICFKDHPWLRENSPFLPCRFQLFEIQRFGAFKTYIQFIKLTLFLRESKPDIVHTFFPVGNIIGVIAARLAGVSAIFSSRRDYGEWMVGSYLSATKFADRFVKKILANSYKVKSLTEKMEKVEGQKVEVILNGIDIEPFKKIQPDMSLKRKLNIPDHHKVIGLIANFRPMKHHFIFIRAAKEILNSRKDVHFLMVGEGTLKKEMEELGSSLGISNYLVFAGTQIEVVPFLSIMDIGVNCSEGEGLSNAIIEYMASGIPSVVSDAGGNPDLVKHNVNGYLFKLDDYQSLASLIIKLLDDVETQVRLKANARNKVERELSLDAMLSKHEEFYHQHLNSAKRTGI